MEKWLKARLFGREKEKIGSLCAIIRKPNGLTLKSNTSERLALSLSRLCVSFFPKHPINAIPTRSRMHETDETQTVFATEKYWKKYCEQKERSLGVKLSLERRSEVRFSRKRRIIVSREDERNGYRITTPMYFHFFFNTSVVLLCHFSTRYAIKVFRLNSYFFYPVFFFTLISIPL